MWEVPENIAVLQGGDETLKGLLGKVGTNTGWNLVGKEVFMIDDGVLYCVGNDCKHLVVPVVCRPLVLHVAHTLPWAGQLGCHKTYLHISSRFYWPSMYNDVQQYCATCPMCFPKV